MSRRPNGIGKPETPRRVAIYTRKSTTMGLEQEFNSLDAQREACVAYCQRQQNWTLVDERYDDGGFTGANTDRPAFTRLMADAEAGKFDIVVVYKVDRLSRSLLDFVKVMERLTAANVSFVSVTQNFTTADAMGRLTMNMLMSFAEFEREMIAERTRDKMAMSRRKGRWTGGQIPLGYRSVDRRLAIDELEAVTVRTVYALFLQHRKFSTVAHLLNDKQILPRGRRTKPGRPIQWSYGAVKGVLTNATYAGLTAFEGQRYRGVHEAIIDEATFERVQGIIAGTERVLRFHGVNHEYVLRGLLRCGLCGQALTPASTSHSHKTYRYYRCITRDKYGTKSCPAAPLAAQSLEQYVVDRISESAIDPALAREVELELDARIQSRRDHFHMLRNQLPGLIANYASNSARFVEELTRLDGPAREMVEARLTTETQRLAGAERQLTEAQHALAKFEQQAVEVQGIVSTLRDFKHVWDTMSVPNRGRLLRALIDRVVIDEPAAKAEIHLVDLTALGDQTTPTTVAPIEAQEAA